MPFFDSPPAIAALVTSVRDTSSPASSILILNQNTTAIEVAASAGMGYIKWLTQSEVDSSVAGTSVIGTGAGSNFDHAIPGGNVRRFIIPIATVPTSQTSAMGANRANGLYPNVAYSGAVTSILSITQYGSSNSY